MSAFLGRSRNLLLRVLFSCCALSLTHCGSDSSSLGWTEDVKLPDGRVVVLERHLDFGGSVTFGGPPSGGPYWFEFKNPDTGEKVRWEWNKPEYLQTVALQIKDGVPYLLTVPGYGNASEYYKCPNPDYLLFKYQGKWVQVPLQEIPFKRIRANMTLSVNHQMVSGYGMHLSIHQVENADDQYKNGRPYALNFSSLKEQRFLTVVTGAGCGESNDALEDPSDSKAASKQ